MTIDEIRAAAEQVMAGDADSVSVLQTVDWYRERATTLAMFVLTPPYGVGRDRMTTPEQIEAAKQRIHDIRREVNSPRFPHGDSDCRFLLAALDAVTAERDSLRAIVEPLAKMRLTFKATLLRENDGRLRVDVEAHGNERRYIAE